MTATETNGSGKAVRTFPAGAIQRGAAAIVNELSVAWTSESSGLAASTA